MDIIKKEIELAQEIEAKAKEASVAELAALELALVGGGCGNEIFG